MRKWIYSGGQVVTDEENRKLRLEYYLEEETRDTKGQTCLYGICVELYREQQDAFLVNREHAPAISYSREFVSGLVGKLRRMSVTPTGLLEAVDDELSAQQLL
ncbi:MAG: DUF6514 family protein [Lachnospiraceae bacterium]|nr:DUF6514 family protein [Lachnospiraceae bacterium]